MGSLCVHDEKAVSIDFSFKRLEKGGAFIMCESHSYAASPNCHVALIVYHVHVQAQHSPTLRRLFQHPLQHLNVRARTLAYWRARFSRSSTSTCFVFLSAW